MKVAEAPIILLCLWLINAEDQPTNSALNIDYDCIVQSYLIAFSSNASSELKTDMKQEANRITQARKEADQGPCPTLDQDISTWTAEIEFPVHENEEESFFKTTESIESDAKSVLCEVATLGLEDLSFRNDFEDSKGAAARAKNRIIV